MTFCSGTGRSVKESRSLVSEIESSGAKRNAEKHVVSKIYLCWNIDFLKARADNPEKIRLFAHSNPTPSGDDAA